ncbi:MAG: outer membrane lipoprotein-sorting protein [Pyrinomonadaceae bacterium]
MRLLLPIVLAAALVGCGTPPPGGSSTEPPAASNPHERGEEIVAEHIRRDAAPFRKDRIRFTISAPDEPVEIFELDVFRRQRGGETNTLSMIVKPDADAGSGSLTTERAGQPTVNITYSVSRDEFRETDTGRMFFGGLTAQELLSEWSKYSYHFIDERDFQGSRVFAVEGRLKKSESSVITLNKLLFDAVTYLPVEMRLFDRTGKELRTFQSKETGSVDGRAFVRRTDVVNHVYNSNITIEILSREFPATLEDSLFDREHLRRSARK